MLIRKILILMTALLLSATECGALTASWRGDLTIGSVRLPIVLNFTENEDGTTSCTLDSPSQGAKGIPAKVTFCSSDSVAVDIAMIGAGYNGRVYPNEIRGIFSQGGYNLPLVLTKEEPIEQRRPQTPKPPFPYTFTDTVFAASDGAVMSATLTMPADASSRKVQAVVMVTGSGPQNRDEEIAEHKPFAVIADFLARHGIASLRYDDRGTALSTGDFQSATTHTFCSDAGAAVSFLRGIAGIGSVGVLGHSEGGTIAFMLGGDGDIDFVVSLAGMAVSGKEALLMQNRHTLMRYGMEETEITTVLQLVGRLFDMMAEQWRDGAVKPIDVDSLVEKDGLKIDSQIMASLRMSQQNRTPWFDAFLNIDPSEYLGKLKCQLLAINGDKDTQVDAQSNLDVIRRCVPQADIRKMPELNHMLQHAETGEVSEYGEIRETISPEVLEIIAEFVNGLEND